MEGRIRVDDAAALSMALELFGDVGLGEVKSMPKEKRDEALAKMKECGLTVRQIQRLTGVSLGVISQA